MKPLQTMVALVMVVSAVLILFGVIAISTGSTRAAGGGVSNGDVTAVAMIAVGLTVYILGSTVGAFAYLCSRSE